jgi:Protein of unknown function (DUF642)
MSKFRFVVVLAAPMFAATFANAKSLPIKSLVPDPPSLCDPIGGNLVSDCGFEMGFSGWGLSGNTVDIFAQGNAIPGFTVVANSGSDFASLGPVGSDGFISQTLSTLPGQLYNISWYLEVGNDSASDPNDFSVTWGSTPVFSMTDLPATSSYAQYSFSEVATSSSTTLKIGFRDDPAYLFLDDVVVNAVPEPGYFAAAGFGLLAILFARKWRLA